MLSGFYKKWKQIQTIIYMVLLNKKMFFQSKMVQAINTVQCTGIIPCFKMAGSLLFDWPAIYSLPAGSLVFYRPAIYSLTGQLSTVLTVSCKSALQQFVINKSRHLLCG
jgi:hypothetical protein